MLCQRISNHPFSYNFNFNTQFTSSTVCAYFRLSLVSSALPVQPRFPSLSSSPEPPLRLFCRDATSPSGAPSEDLEGHIPSSTEAHRAVAALRVPLQQPNSSAQHPLRPLQQQSPLPKPAKAPPLKPRAWRLIRGSAAPTAIHRHCLMACLVRFDPKPPLSLVCLAASGIQAGCQRGQRGLKIKRRASPPTSPPRNHQPPRSHSVLYS